MKNITILGYIYNARSHSQSSSKGLSQTDQSQSESRRCYAPWSVSKGQAISLTKGRHQLYYNRSLNYSRGGGS